jgi:hypothetical protein
MRPPLHIPDLRKSALSEHAKQILYMKQGPQRFTALKDLYAEHNDTKSCYESFFEGVLSKIVMSKYN